MTINLTRIFERRKTPRLSVAGLLIAAALGAQTATVSVHDAWARVPLPSKKDAAVYMVLENSGSQRRAVVSASTDAAAKVEMHEMKTIPADKSDGRMAGMGGMDKMADRSMMTMMPLKEIAVPAGGKTTLGPNGIHLMVFGLKGKPAAGDKLTVTLKLDDGTTVPVTAVFRN
jgi:hypothetical protein